MGIRNQRKSRIIGLILCLLMGSMWLGEGAAYRASAAELEVSQVSVNWEETGSSISPLAYGQNANKFLHESSTGDANYMTQIRYLNGNQGLVRIHSTSMISTGGWLNGDLTWNEAKIVAALTPLVEEGYPVMINIPYGPNGKNDYQDAEAFAQFAAQLVKIVNVDHGLGIQYWEIPNERESGFATPGLSVSAMANLVKESYMAMKAIDPTIIVGGPATSDANVPYLSSVVEQALPYIDFVSMHAYSSGQSRPSTDSAAYNHAQNQGALVSHLRSSLLAIGPQADLPIFVDEYNMTWDTDPRLHTNKEAVYSALLVSNVIGGDGTGVNFWHAEGSSMGLMNDRNELYDTADLHHWLNRFFHGERIKPLFSNKSKVDGFAAKQNQRKSVLLVNRTDDEQRVQLQQAGSAPAGWEMYRIDENGSSHESGVDGTGLASAGMVLPAHSVTVLTSGTNASLIEHIPYTLTNAETSTLLTVTDTTYRYTHEAKRLTDQQRWVLMKLGPNHYEIRSQLDGSVLSVTYNTYSVASQWELVPAGGQGYALKAPGTNLVLSASGDPQDEYVLLEDDSVAPRQRWLFEYAGPRTEIIDHAQHSYQIINKASGKVLQISNSRKVEGAIANLQNDAGLASQKWSFSLYDSGSGFRIINGYSRMLIHAVAGARVTQAPFWYDPPRQLWTLEKQVEGDYIIRNNLTSQVLQPKDGSLLEGVVAVTGTYTGEDYQRWYIQKDTRNHVAPTIEQDTDYVLQNLATGKVISVANASLNTSASVIQTTYTGNPEQRWRFGWYINGTRITNKNSGLALSPNSSFLSIQQTFAFHDTNQQWILEKQADETYLLIYAANRKVLQPVGGSSADGARLEWAEPAGTDVQKWILTRM
ncbi:MAG: hypothetical protein K0R57_5474 [Paenibacillaceae bacterium]|nr:hypothetical protein [Paenibacillaceae bacterium]